MTPVVSKFVLGAKAATRGTLNRQAMNKRWLTLPPGSVRGYPSFEEYQDSSDNDALYQDSRARAQMKMSPQRNYGTISAQIPQLVQHVVAPISSSFREDYDNLNIHAAAASSTNCNLGQIIEDHGDIFSTTVTGDVVHFSDISSFSATNSEEDYFTTLERRLGITDLLSKDDAMVADGKY